jgi:hypothetical protein
MPDIIINNSLLSAINSQNLAAQNNNAQNLGQGASAASQAANITAGLPPTLLGSTVTANVTTNQQLGQVQVNIPQFSNFLPQAEITLTTNQTQLLQGQQVQVQIPDANNFTRTNNILIANVNITTSDVNTGATQNFNGRINIVLPNQASSNTQNNNFIQQNISNPESLVGKNLSAYFISAPDKNLVQNISGQNPQASILQGVSQSSLVSENISGLQIKISNITLPNNAPLTNAAVTNAPITNASSANTLNAENFSASVVFSGDNETILNTSLGTLRLPVNLQLPVGTNLQFNISGLDLKNLVANKELQITNLETLKQYLASDNTALKDLLSALTNNSANNPNPAVNQAAQAQIPNTVDKFIFSRAIWFLGNVSNNSADKWLSDDNKKILGRNNASPEIGKLDSLFSALKSFFTPADAPAQGAVGAWNNFTVPFLDSENKLNYVNFYTEQNQSSNDENNGKTATRFIVELNNSYFGEVQIDGLLTNSDNINMHINAQAPQNKKLDIIFRYSSEISEEDKINLREVFFNSIEISGLKGDIQLRKTEAEDIPRPYNNPNYTNNNLGQINSINPNGYVI